MRGIFLVVILFTLGACATPEVLISQNDIYKGMTKRSLDDVMLNRAFPVDDITMSGCTRNYFPDTQHEIFSSESRKLYYLFEKVTISEGDSCKSLVGNGYLLGAYRTIQAALLIVNPALAYSNLLEEAQSEENDANQEKNQLIEVGSGTAFAITKSDGDQYVGEIKDSKRDGQGTVISVSGYHFHNGREEISSPEVLDSISKYGSRIAAEIKQKKQAEAEANQKCLQYEDDKGTFKVAEVIYSAVGILKSNSCNQSSYAEERRKFFFEEILARAMIEDVKKGKYPERCSDVISNAINNILEKQKNKGHNSSICQDAKSLLDRFTK